MFSRCATLMFGLLLCACSAVPPKVADVTADEARGDIRSTASGPVRGVEGDVFSFLGIPYASAPTGDLRWRAPRPVKPWNDVREAVAFAPDCYGSSRLREGSLAPGVSEDCLYLNIWTPRNPGDGPLPVMVWVYGGGFVGGTSAMPFYDGEALAKKGVVVVSINYRVNIFGFFSHPQLSAENVEGVSGNYGLQDILAALGWVKENINEFGGDPSRVTVFGESAGASALGLLMTSPLSDGLIDQAILESPGMLRPLASLSESEEAGRVLGENISQLRAVEPVELMELARTRYPDVRKLLAPRPIGPIADGWVLPTTDSVAIANKAFLKVPTIIGSNSDEGRIFVERAPVDTVGQYRDYLKDQFGDNAEEFEACYPAVSDEDVKSALSSVFGDNQFNRGVEIFADALGQEGVPVWRYLFTGVEGEGRTPATHGAEIPFVFGNLGPASVEWFASLLGGATVADRQLSDEISDAWVSFAKSGNPNEEGRVDWPEYRSDRKVRVFGGASDELDADSISVVRACPMLGTLN